MPEAELERQERGSTGERGDGGPLRPQESVRSCHGTAPGGRGGKKRKVAALYWEKLVRCCHGKGGRRGRGGDWRSDEADAVRFGGLEEPWPGRGWSREGTREGAEGEMSLGGGDVLPALGGRLGWRKTSGDLQRGE